MLHQGIKPVSAACWSDAVPTKLHPQPNMCWDVYLYSAAKRLKAWWSLSSERYEELSRSYHQGETQVIKSHVKVLTTCSLHMNAVCVIQNTWKFTKLLTNRNNLAPRKHRSINTEFQSNHKWKFCFTVHDTWHSVYEEGLEKRKLNELKMLKLERQNSWQ